MSKPGEWGNACFVSFLSVQAALKSPFLQLYYDQESGFVILVPWIKTLYMQVCEGLGGEV